MPFQALCDIGLNFVFFVNIQFWEHLINGLEPASSELGYNFLVLKEDEMRYSLDLVAVTNINTIDEIDIYDTYFLFVNVLLFYFLDGSSGRHWPVSDETHDGYFVLFDESVCFLFAYQGTEFVVCDLLYYTVHFFLLFTPYFNLLYLF